ncbi:MAG: NADH-quinone oxidoreductase subunit A [Opitutaceae bacterium]|jgi:NADH-quinone oxidoreductase subunit A|nr:NADH-quinone oxidoreductase subunit A [Opitutaceae bacterium]
MNACLPVFLQLALAAAVAAGVVAASQFLGQRRRRATRLTDTPYECGVNGGPLADQARFNVKFLVTALLFLLLDVETVLLLPWVFVFRDFLANGAVVVAPLLVFAGVIAAGLFYEFRRGALEWER